MSSARSSRCGPSGASTHLDLIAEGNAAITPPGRAQDYPHASLERLDDRSDPDAVPAT